MKRGWLAALILSGCAGRGSAPAAGEPLVPLGKNPQGASEFLRGIDGMVVIRVPAGEFIFGDDRGDPEERPRRTLSTGDYLIDKFEVTNAQFAKFLNSRAADVDDAGNALVDPAIRGVERAGGTWRAERGRERHPVTAATYFGAVAYARWAGGRLPTDVEWEKAARGTDGRTYPWGEEAPDPSFCNFYSSGLGDTAPVGSYPKGVSAYGCLDMAGNVYERVNSQAAMSRGRVSSSIRSSGFVCPLAFQMRASDRCGYSVKSSHTSVGFRCVMDVPASLNK